MVLPDVLALTKLNYNTFAATASETASFPPKSEPTQNAVHKYYWILIIDSNKPSSQLLPNVAPCTKPPRILRTPPIIQTEVRIAFKRPHNGSARSLSPSRK